ncbi:MAG: outer membrane beta-barrel protein [Sediminibacterium sp.]
MRNRIFMLILSMFFSGISSAQTNSTGSISGKLIDSASKQPMNLATVSVFRAVDTVLITYRLSSETGEFKVTGLPLDVDLRMVISYSGYTVSRKEFKLSADGNSLDAGTISMAPNSGLTLDDVLVIAERPPVVVKKDTIEFNAASFKTLPTALVEDLLKKLPGVQLDADGNITVNGKKVNRIMVDGKDFFGGDPKMATRNLPANLIDKVQVSDDKDELELNPDKAKADVGQVINLKLKKAIKQGMFGKAYAGKADANRYEAGGIVNMFRDTLQVSVLGFSNNLNKAGFGFNDIRSLGGFDRSGINSISINGNGGLNVNGISFGGTGQGIQQSGGIGFNLNNEFKKGLTLNTQYFYGSLRNDIAELENRQQFFGDTILTSRTNKSEVAYSKTHRLGFGLRWKIDTTSRMEFRPVLTVANNTSDRLSDISTNSSVDGLLNTSSNLQTSKARDLGYSHVLSYFKSFKKKGRSFNFVNSVQLNAVNTDQFNNVANIFYPTGSSNIDQLRDQERANFSTSTNLNYAEPLLKDLTLRLGYNLTFFENKDALATYNKDAGSGKYDVINSLLTNHVERTSWRNNLSSALNFRYKKLSITASLNFLWLDLFNRYVSIGQKLDQHYNYILPGANISWKEFNLSYNANVNPPGISDIQPVPDNSNPLYIVKGNPNLKPGISHGFNLNFFKNVTQKQMFISAYLGGYIGNNGVVRSRDIAPNGVQTTTPLNADGIHNFYTNLYFNKQQKVNQKFSFNYGTGYNVNYTRNFLIINSKKSYVKTVDFNPFIRTGINLNDKFEWNISYSRNYNNSYYESNEFKNLNVERQSLSSDMVIRLPKKFVWELTLDHRYNSQVAPGVQKTISLLNAGLTYLFLKDDNGQLKFSVSDLLNQNRSVYRYSSENFITDKQVNILQRYFMLTFTYNIRSFGAAGKGGGNKVGGRQSLFFF